ncbi:MAG TPA: GspH/FimT family pseudopilin [Gammaproteobacteria bacterium]|nr:GspH/FimT family pseudopilin [Gammaproteobacteria bacterium]
MFRRARGFTLWELLCTCAIAGAVLGLAVPSVRGTVLDMRRTAEINELVLSIQLARSAASKRGLPVVICKSADRFRCAGGDFGFETGWIVFVDLDGARPPQRSPDEPLLLAHAPLGTGTISSNRDYFELRPIQRRSVNGTLVFCDDRGARAARAVIVSYTGRPRVASTDSSGAPLRCAGRR